MHDQPIVTAQRSLGTTPSAQQPAATAPSNLLYGPSDVSTRRPRDAVERRAVGLGWFSLGLGLVQILAPRQVARAIGASNSLMTCSVIRACGVREVVSGLGILMQPRPNPFLWTRLAGDVVDVALLTGQLATSTRRTTLRLGIATAAALGTTVLDAKTTLDLTRVRRGEDLDLGGIHVKQSITINAPPQQVYSFWRNLENLPKFMAHLESVEVANGSSKWRAKAPAGASVEWEAEVTVDKPNSLIGWRSLPGSTVPNHGSVRFVPAPGNRGTEVHVELVYEPPGGAFAAVLAKLFGEEPKQQIKGDLRRLKQVLETGEVTHSDASIHSGTHPAQPSSQPRRKPTAPTRALITRAQGATNASVARSRPSDSGGSAPSPRPSSTSAQRKLSTAAPPKPTTSEPPATGAQPPEPSATGGQATTSSDAPNDAIPFTHFTNQGFGTTRDDDAS